MTDCRNSRVELLQRAGLDIVGDGWAEDVLPPSASWHPLAAFDAVPTIAVPRGGTPPGRDRPTPVTRLRGTTPQRPTEIGPARGRDPPAPAPARTLIRLLRDTATADSAAQNPALPVAVMHYMLDSAATGPASSHGR
ncbi:hypothetical protein [Streptomyces sp. NPDC002346]